MSLPEFTCSYCGQVKVVASLARDCERRHEAELSSDGTDDDPSR